MLLNRPLYWKTKIFFRSRKPRSKLPGKILISLSTSLMLLLIVFLTGIERTSNTRNCRAVAALLHYFILTTFLWMGAEAANLYQMFVKVFQTRSQKAFLIQASIIAWGKQLSNITFFLFAVFIRLPCNCRTVTLVPGNKVQQRHGKLIILDVR